MRAAETADAEAIASVYRPYVTDSVASFEQTPPDGDEIARRMLAPPRLPWYVATRQGAVVGYSYASRHRARAAYRWSVECSVYLAESARGQGIGRALYERLMAELTRLGYVTALAGVTLPNDASVRFHEAVGFTTIGVSRSVGFKHGAWRDVQWLQRTLAEPSSAPLEPMAWTPTADEPR